LGKHQRTIVLGVYNLSGLVAHELSDLESGSYGVTIRTFFIDNIVNFSY